MDVMDDYMIVNAILLRDKNVTQQYLYIKYYPLFKSVYDNYYTDCQSCLEFINEIYIHLLTPNKNTGLCKLQTFKFGSTFATWLKTVAVYYCYEHYRRKQKVTFVEEKNETENNRSDRLEQYSASMYAEEHIMCREDLEALLSLMPNKRYALIIKLRYFEGLSNEDTAAALQMSMDNFYNKHMRAKKQFNEIIKKEYGILL
jgi:RNA polymerase sigma factor (sigma-70 family)